MNAFRAFALVLIALNSVAAVRQPVVTSHPVMPNVRTTAPAGPEAPPPVPVTPVKPVDPEFYDRTNILAHVQSPWRIVEGETNVVVATGWMHFWGQVLDVQPDCIRVEGHCSFVGGPWGETEFMVVHFPYRVADGDSLPFERYLMAKRAGTMTYVTVMGASRTLHKLDYGTACQPPEIPKPSQEEIAAVKEKAAQQKTAADQRVLKYHQDLAEKMTRTACIRWGDAMLRATGWRRTLLRRDSSLSVQPLLAMKNPSGLSPNSRIQVQQQVHSCLVI